MAVILLIAEGPSDSDRSVALALGAAGHFVVRCTGGTPPAGGCRMLLRGRCVLPEVADAIVYRGRPSAPMFGRTYRGRDVLAAYRRHPVYGRKPMLVVSSEPVACADGSGPIARVDPQASPEAIVGAIEALCSHARLEHHTRLPASVSR